MKQALVGWVLLLSVFSAVTLNAHPDEKATKQECIAKCKAAAALIQKVGPDAALEQLNHPESGFTWKDSYVFVFETEKATLLSHPTQRLLGWSMLEFRSADNILVFREILDHPADRDQGWISYQVLIDQKPPAVQKATYYIKVPETDLVVAAGYYEGVKTLQNQVPALEDRPNPVKIEEFARIDGLLHGIVFDGKGNMFVGKNGKEIVKVLPDGSVSPFTEIEAADGKNELFLDGKQSTPSLNAVVGFEFGPDYRHLFACDGKLGAGKLVKIEVLSDGCAASVELLYHNEKLNTEYMAFDDDANLILKGPWSASFIRVDQRGKAETLKHAHIGYGIQTIARGGKGFGENVFFGTHMPVGIVYKITFP